MDLRLKLGILAAGAATVLVLACSTETIKAPKSDKNFDDPDDPGNTGTVGAADASTADAGSGVIPCSKSSDCPSSTFTCYFPTGGGCSAQGQCIVYETTSGCTSHTQCGCDGKTFKECAPPGFASKPVENAGPCGADSGSDSATDAPDDAPGDAPMD